MTAAVTHWVHNLDPVLLKIYGPFGIRYYGLSYILAFIIAFLLLRLSGRKGKCPLTEKQQSTAFTALILGVFLGGRLGYILLYAFSGLFHNPLVVFRIWEGGMSSHGGFLGVLIAVGWISKKFRVSYLKLLDLMALLTPPGLMLGRIANFINGELWGKVSLVPWAVIFPQSMPPGTPLQLIPPRHPAQLYEAAWEGLLLMGYTQWRFWKTGVQVKPGRLASEFLLLYAMFRILGEQFREPDTGLILGMSRGIFYSFFLAVLGGWLLYKSCRKNSTRY